MIASSKVDNSMKILCTTGTSIASGCPALAHLLQHSQPWEFEAPELRQQLAAKLATLDLSRPEAQRRLSAETHALQRLGISAGTEVILLASDTAEGRVCAEMLRDAVLLAFELTEEAVRIERVAGLQVRNPQQLRQAGLPNLIRGVIDEIRAAARVPGQRVVLNSTGGFKGVAPFIAVLGMILGVRTVYVFEFAETLIDLPPLPITFDLQLYQRARPALQEILRHGRLTRESFLSHIGGFEPFETDLFLGFVEPDEAPEMVRLSPLAVVLVEMDVKGPGKVKLSPAVRSLGDQLKGAQRRRFELLLSRVAQPIWRTIHFHAIAGTDLEPYKPGNVPERLAGITTADAFYLCEYYPNHDRYMRDLPNRRKARYNLEAFSDWQASSSDAELTRLLADDCEREYQALLEKERDLEAVIAQRVEAERLRLLQRLRKEGQLGGAASQI